MQAAIDRVMHTSGAPRAAEAHRTNTEAFGRIRRRSFLRTRIVLNASRREAGSIAAGQAPCRCKERLYEVLSQHRNWAAAHNTQPAGAALLGKAHILRDDPRILDTGRQAHDVARRGQS